MPIIRIAATALEDQFFAAMDFISTPRNVVIVVNEKKEPILGILSREICSAEGSKFSPIPVKEFEITAEKVAEKIAKGSLRAITMPFAGADFALGYAAHPDTANEFHARFNPKLVS